MQKKFAQTLYVYIDILDIYHIDFMEEYFVKQRSYTVQLNGKT